MPHFVHVVLPLKLDFIPTYSCEEPVQAGTAVKVLFAGRKYVGAVLRTGITPDIPESRILPVLSVESEAGTFSEREMRLWEFIADYYLCTIGEVFKAVCPVFRFRRAEARAARQMRLQERTEKLEAKLDGRLQRLHARLDGIEAKLSGRHREDIRARLEEMRQSIEAEIQRAEAEREALTSGAEAGAGAEAARECPSATIPNVAGSKSPAPCRPVLLRGHGRTQTYIAEIRRSLDAGRQVLLLSPEIYSCRGLHDAIAAETGSGRMHLVTSESTPARRDSTAMLLREGEPALVIGTRSAIFLPFSRLDLVIVDNEQDRSFKQAEPAPYYNARDCAVYLASLHGARVMLGSAAPSLESIYNCMTGRYTLQETSAPEDPSPRVEVIDTGAERRKRGMDGALSFKLIQEIRDTRGRVCLLCGWEDRAQLSQRCAELFGSREVELISMQELRQGKALGAELIGVLQADAFLSRDDFRSDEKAIQLAEMLSGIAPSVFIQTAVPQRFDPSRSLESLMDERRQFGFPPFTRIVDIRDAEGGIVRREFLARDASLHVRKAALAASCPKGCSFDVDPL